MDAKEAFYKAMRWTEDAKDLPGQMNLPGFEQPKPPKVTQSDLPGALKWGRKPPKAKVPGSTGDPLSELEKHDRDSHKGGYKGGKCIYRAQMAAAGIDVGAIDKKRGLPAPKDGDYSKGEKQSQETETTTEEQKKNPEILEAPEKVDVGGTDLEVTDQTQAAAAELLKKYLDDPEISEEKKEGAKAIIEKLQQKLKQNDAAASPEKQEAQKEEEAAKHEETIEAGKEMGAEIASAEGQMDLLVKNHEQALAGLAQQIEALGGKEPETTALKNELDKENKKFAKEFQKLDPIEEGLDGTQETPEDHAKHCKANPKSNCPFLKSAMSEEQLKQVDAQSPKGETPQAEGSVKGEESLQEGEAQANGAVVPGQTQERQEDKKPRNSREWDREFYEREFKNSPQAEMIREIFRKRLDAGVTEFDVENNPYLMQLLNEVLEEKGISIVKYVNKADLSEAPAEEPQEGGIIDVTEESEEIDKRKDGDGQKLIPEQMKLEDKSGTEVKAEESKEAKGVESHGTIGGATGTRPGIIGKKDWTPAQKAALEELANRFGAAVEGIKKGVDDAKFTRLLNDINQFKMVKSRWATTPNVSAPRNAVREGMSDLMDNHVDKSYSDATVDTIQKLLEQDVLVNEAISESIKDDLDYIQGVLTDPQATTKEVRAANKMYRSLVEKYGLDEVLSERGAGGSAGDVPFTPENLKIFDTKYTGPIAGTDLLDPPSNQTKQEESLTEAAEKIAQRFKDIGIEVGDLVNKSEGPSQGVLTFSVAPGFNLSKAQSKETMNALTMALGSGSPVQDIRAGDEPDTIKVTFASKNPREVRFSDVITSEEWKKQSGDMAIPNAVGIDSQGKVVIKDAAKGPHERVVGTTGTGKSVYLQTKIAAPKMSKSPKQWKQILVDPKQQEFTNEVDSPYNWCPVQFTAKGTANMLKRLVQEMQDRASTLGINLDEYNELTGEGIANPDASKNLQDYNKANAGKELPFISLVIDEAHSLTKDPEYGKEIIASLGQLLAKARSVGINVTVATQRGDVESLPGSLAANLPTSTEFAAASDDAKGTKGAKALKNAGDFIQKDKQGRETTGRACWLKDHEIQKIHDFYKKHSSGKGVEEPKEETTQATTSATPEAPAAEPTGNAGQEQVTGTISEPQATAEKTEENGLPSPAETQRQTERETVKESLREAYDIQHGALDETINEAKKRYNEAIQKAKTNTQKKAALDEYTRTKEMALSQINDWRSSNGMSPIQDINPDGAYQIEKVEEETSGSETAETEEVVSSEQESTKEKPLSRKEYEAKYPQTREGQMKRLNEERDAALDAKWQELSEKGLSPAQIKQDKGYKALIKDFASEEARIDEQFPATPAEEGKSGGEGTPKKSASKGISIKDDVKSLSEEGKMRYDAALRRFNSAISAAKEGLNNDTLDDDQYMEAVNEATERLNKTRSALGFSTAVKSDGTFEEAKGSEPEVKGTAPLTDAPEQEPSARESEEMIVEETQEVEPPAKRSRISKARMDEIKAQATSAGEESATTEPLGFASRNDEEGGDLPKPTGKVPPKNPPPDDDNPPGGGDDGGAGGRTGGSATESSAGTGTAEPAPAETGKPTTKKESASERVESDTPADAFTRGMENLEEKTRKAMQSDSGIQALQAKVVKAKAEHGENSKEYKTAARLLESGQKRFAEAFRKSQEAESGVKDTRTGAPPPSEVEATTVQNKSHQDTLQTIPEPFRETVQKKFNDGWDDEKKDSFMQKASAYFSRNKGLTPDQAEHYLSYLQRETEKIGSDRSHYDALAKAGNPISVMGGDDYASQNGFRVRDAVTPKGAQPGSVKDYLAHLADPKSSYFLSNRKGLGFARPSKDSPLRDAYDSLSAEAKSLFFSSKGGQPLDTIADDYARSTGRDRALFDSDALAQHLNKEAEKYASWRDGHAYSEIAAEEHAARQSEENERSDRAAEEAVLFNAANIEDMDKAEKDYYNNIMGEVSNEINGNEGLRAPLTRENLAKLHPADLIRFNESDKPFVVMKNENGVFDIISYDDWSQAVFDGSIDNGAPDMIHYTLSHDGSKLSIRQPTENKKGPSDGKRTDGRREKEPVEAGSGTQSGERKTTSGEGQEADEIKETDKTEKGDDFSLQSVTQEQINSEQKAQKQKDAIKRRQNAPIKGGGDLWQETELGASGVGGQGSLFDTTQESAKKGKREVAQESKTEEAKANNTAKATESTSEKEIAKQVEADKVIKSLTKKVNEAKSPSAKVVAQKRLDSAKNQLTTALRKAATEKSGVEDVRKNKAEQASQSAATSTQSQGSPELQKAIDRDTQVKEFREQAAEAEKLFGKDSEEHRRALKDVEKAKQDAKINSAARFYQESLKQTGITAKEKAAELAQSRMLAEELIKDIETKNATALKRKLATFAQKGKEGKITYPDDGGSRKAFELLTGLKLPVPDKEAGDFRQSDPNDSETQGYIKRMHQWVDDFCGVKESTPTKKTPASTPSKQEPPKKTQEKESPKPAPQPEKKKESALAPTTTTSNTAPSGGETPQMKAYRERQEARAKAEKEAKEKAAQERARKLEASQQKLQKGDRGLNKQNAAFLEEVRKEADTSQSKGFKALSNMKPLKKVDNAKANDLNRQFEEISAEMQELSEKLKPENELSKEETRQTVGLLEALRKGLEDVVNDKKLGEGNFHFRHLRNSDGKVIGTKITKFRDADGKMKDVEDIKEEVKQKKSETKGKEEASSEEAQSESAKQGFGIASQIREQGKQTAADIKNRMKNVYRNKGKGANAQDEALPEGWYWDEEVSDSPDVDEYVWREIFDAALVAMR